MQNENSPARSRQLIGLLLLMAALLILFVVFVDVKEVGRQLRHADPRYLLASSLLLVLGLVAYAVRWRLLLGNRPSLLYVFHAGNIGHAGNILIPARGGVLLRVLVMGRNDAVSTAEAAASYLVERLFEQGMRLLALFGAIAIGAGIELSAAGILSGLAIVALAFAGIFWLARRQQMVVDSGSAWLSRLPRITVESARKQLRGLLATVNAVSTPSQLILIATWSFIPWSFFWGFFILVLMGLGGDLAAETIFPISLGALALSPPSAATQPGIFHAVVVAPLAAVGYDLETLTAYAVLLHILETIWMMLLAIWGLVHTKTWPPTLRPSSSG